MRAIATGAQGPQGPSFRIRLMMPAAELRKHDVTLVALPLLTASQADAVHSGSPAARARAVIAGRRRFSEQLRRVQDASVVVVQREVDLLPGRALERAVIDGRALVLDIDDAVWLAQPGSHPLARLRRGPAKLRWLAARADRVIAGNEYLAAWLRQHAHDVHVVPSLVDTDNVALRVHRESRTVVLGWIGSPSTARYLSGLAPVLASFAASRPEMTIELVVVGGRAPAIEGVRCEQHVWSEASETAALARMDVGLMPMPDDAWTRGKCAYKALQYMSAGIPVLADDVGLTGEAVGHEVGGLLARSPADWARALDRLATSAALRESLGRTGRARVEADFSVQAWAPRLARLISGVG
jgi:glycosyltransferase involved in cell wall biosynthesis